MKLCKKITHVCIFVNKIKDLINHLISINLKFISEIEINSSYNEK